MVNMFMFIKKLSKYLITYVLGQKPKVRHIWLGSLWGTKFTIDPRSNLSDLFGILREPHLQRLLGKYLQPGDTVFDIGANTGFFTLLMSRLVGENGRVFAFEPIPETAESLSHHLKINSISNVKLLVKGVTDNCGVTDFRVPDNGRNHSMASMFWHKRDPNSVVIQAGTIVIDEDVELSDINPKFIKIDVEGSEGVALKGMKQLLRRARPILFLECSDIGRQQTWDIMRSLGYSCFDVGKEGRKVSEYAKYRHSDYIWIP